MRAVYIKFVDVSWVARRCRL